MPTPEQPTPAQPGYNQTIQRCAEAYLHVRAKLPKGALSWSNDAQENQHKAFLAFAAHLPVLIDPPSFQLYIACIANGAAIGAIDPADAGRFCHLAQTAMSAWKLANITLPEAQRKEKEAAEKSEKKATLPPPKGNQPDNQAGQSQPAQPFPEAKLPPKGEEKATPLPPKGNHPGESEIDQAILHALENMPVYEVQKQHFQSLRNRGILLPCDGELRDHPLAALHFVRMSERLLREETLAEIAAHSKPGQNSGPEPAPAQPEQRSQAA